MRVYREACVPVDLSRHQPEGLRLRFIDADDLRQWAQMLSCWIPFVLEREADWAKYVWGG
jgi:hypothetical protein